MLATAFAMSLAGCATMDLESESLPGEAELSEIQVKIPGTWWDSKRVKVDEIVASREKKLAQEAKTITPYATASANGQVEISNAPPGLDMPPLPPVPPSRGLIFQNVLEAGEPISPAPWESVAEAPAPSRPVAKVPTPAVMSPPVAASVQQAFHPQPRIRETSQPARPAVTERAPPLPNTVVPIATNPVASPPFAKPKITLSEPDVAKPAVNASKPIGLRLRGVVHSGHGGLVAMLETADGATQMAREGDTLLVNGDDGEARAFQVQRIANQQILIRGDDNRNMVIQ
jgi:hypothetical protein